MESNWAAEHLQTIRTLMERSAVYRRALAPVMILAGCLGVAAAVVPCFIRLESSHTFSLFWVSVGMLSLIACFLLVRRQALKESEPIWSPPTRRVTEAVLPGFLLGLAAGAACILGPAQLVCPAWLLAVIWIVTYGCALHAAGFFMQRGIKLFGWVFMMGGCAVFFAAAAYPQLQTTAAAHYVMGIFFGLLHFAYGIYLYFTEKRRNAT